MGKRHDNLRDIRKVLRIEKEEHTLYGLHNMDSFHKIRDSFKYFLIKPITESTIQVKKYSDDEETIMEYLRDNPEWVLMMNGEIII